jgi:hypothetical protein
MFSRMTAKEPEEIGTLTASGGILNSAPDSFSAGHGREDHKIVPHGNLLSARALEGILRWPLKG